MHGAVKKLHNLIKREVLQVQIPVLCTTMPFVDKGNMPGVSEQVQIKKEPKKGQRRHHG